MWNGERIRYSEEQPQNKQGKIKIYLVRHGEIERHEKHQPTLTARGSEQAREVPHKAFPFIRERQKCGIGVNIYTFYARLDRTAETAIETEYECRRIVDKENLSNILIFRATPSPLLEASNSIEPLVKIGISKQEAIYLWLTAREEDLASWGVATFPSDVHRKLKRFIDGTTRLNARWNECRDNILFWITQETVQAALLNYLSQQSPVVMEYTESIEIIPIPDEAIVYEFRGKQYFDKKKGPDINA